MIFHSKTLIIFFSLTTLGLATLLGYGFYSITSQNQETAEYLEQVNQSAMEELLVQSLRKVRDGSEEEIARFEERVFTKDKAVKTIEELGSVAQALGVESEITNVDELESVGDAGYGGLRVALHGNGSWSSVFTWLQALESLPYRVIVDNVNFSKQEEGWKVGLSLIIPSFD